MTAASARSAFDSIARDYDRLWSKTPAGMVQRRAVWRVLESYFAAGSRVLDIGCGTGVDALFLTARGVSVTGIDASPEMVRVAREKGVNAYHVAAEELDELTEGFDGALSNFGALNCVEHLQLLGESLARRLRPGGILVLCVLGRFCLWENFYYLGRGNVTNAFRRLRGGSSCTSLGIQVAYPTVRELARTLRPHFRLMRWEGVGIAVPPSYVPGLQAAFMVRLAAFDSYVSRWPVVRAMADHRLLVFERV